MRSPRIAIWLCVFQVSHTDLFWLYMSLYRGLAYRIVDGWQNHGCVCLSTHACRAPRYVPLRKIWNQACSLPLRLIWVEAVADTLFLGQFCPLRLKPAMPLVPSSFRFWYLLHSEWGICWFRQMRFCQLLWAVTAGMRIVRESPFSVDWIAAHPTDLFLCCTPSQADFQGIFWVVLFMAVFVRLSFADCDSLSFMGRRCWSAA